MACEGARTGGPGAAGPGPTKGKERTSFFRVSFLSIRRDEGHGIRASCPKPYVALLAPEQWESYTVHTVFEFAGGWGCSSSCSSFFFLHFVFLPFSLSLSLFFSLLSSFISQLSTIRTGRRSRPTQRLLWDRPAFASLLLTPGLASSAFPA